MNKFTITIVKKEDSWDDFWIIEVLWYDENNNLFVKSVQDIIWDLKRTEYLYEQWLFVDWVFSPNDSLWDEVYRKQTKTWRYFVKRTNISQEVPIILGYNKEYKRFNWLYIKTLSDDSETNNLENFDTF